MLPGYLVATVAAHQLPEVPELGQLEVFTIQDCHPVHRHMMTPQDKILRLQSEYDLALVTVSKCSFFHLKQTQVFHLKQTQV